jgi:hypothetical protein
MNRIAWRPQKLRPILLVGILLAGSGLLGVASGAQADQPSSSFTGTTTVSRTFVDADGTTTTVDKNTIKLRVSQTANLRGRQELGVSWSGAHPTGNVATDINSGDAAKEEYPLVLLECRGINGAGAGADAITPETCWTATWNERFQSDLSTGWPAWRSDEYATTADRQASVGAPTPRPVDCNRAAVAERWLPFKAEDGTVYPGGVGGCAGQAPESSNVGGAAIPSNTTYGVTQKDGTGSTQFDVWTQDENASLGCSDTVPCSLVAVPIEGTSCDAYGTKLPAADRPLARYQAAAVSNCEATGQYAAGQADDPGTPPDLAVEGALWWSASNWRNRITVPLSFATPASVCSVVSKYAPQAIYGSVLMTELAAQWEPKFCTDSSLYPFIHVQASDAEARNLLTSGSIDAAFTSRLPDGGFANPTVQAPVAMTGFAISYSIDDANGVAYHSLHLDARLLAKLLTMSYPGNSLVKDNYPALARNPMNITDDPEFIQLNPGLPKYVQLEAASTLQSLSSDADLMYSLTSYINSDPAARAWLNGNPDPWGMTVNPNYLDIALPVESWPLLDSFTLPQSYIDSGNNLCYSNSPAPYLQLIANPSSLLQTIVQNIQFAVSNVNIACPNGMLGDVGSLRLSTQGRQSTGHRFVIGVTSISAARRYSLATAALAPASAASDAAPTFVSPDDAGLKAAASALETDKTQNTWALNYGALASTTGAYPGAMPVYADIPTTHLSSTVAKHLAGFLTYAAGAGQKSGTANGDLPPGYLPLTAANGLAAQASFTGRAAAAVAAQQGAIPSLVAPPTTGPTSSGPTPPTSAPATPTSPTVTAPTTTPNLGGSTPTEPVGPGVSTSPGSTTSPTTSASGSASPSKSASSSSAAPGTQAVKTVGATSRLSSWALPIVLGLGVLCALAGGMLRYPTAAKTAATTVRSRGRRR